MRKGFIRCFVFLMIFPIVWIGPVGAKEKDTQAALKGFDEFVNQTLKEWKVPGAAVCIIKDGQVILSKGYGFKDVKNGLQVTQKTIFAIGSSSKAFTTAAMGILVDEGKLNWDTPVRHYLPAFKLKDPFASERMTPRDLVIHNSGLPRHDASWYGSAATRQELFERLPYLEPSHDFRTTYQYNNFMFMTAGYLVGQITGTTWEGFVKERIFEPLGMDNSNFSVEDSQKEPDFSLPYREKHKEVIEIPFCNIAAIGPAGSINSNIEDLAKWVQLHLNKGKWGEKQILSETVIKEIHAPQIVFKMPELDMIFDSGEMLPWMYGMAWMLTPYRGHLIVHHGGNIDGFSALVSFMPRENLGAVILTNLDGTLATMPIAFNVYDRLLGLDQVPWNKRLKELMSKLEDQQEQMKKESTKDRRPDTKPSHPLEDYAGEYQNPGYGIMTVRLEGGELKGRYNSTAGALKHYHFDVFELYGKEDDRGEKVSFFSDLKGNIDRLSVQLEPSVDPIIFVKMPEKKMTEKGFLEKFVGEYELQGMIIKIVLRGENTLFASIPGQPEAELVPYKGTEFTVKNAPNVSIEFIADDAGNVTEARVNQGGMALTAKKK